MKPVKVEPSTFMKLNVYNLKANYVATKLFEKSIDLYGYVLNFARTRHERIEFDSLHFKCSLHLGET